MRVRVLVALGMLLAIAAPARATTGLANVERLVIDDFPDIQSPEAVALSSPDGAFVYVAASIGGIVVFARDPVTGKLTQTSVVNSATLGDSFRPRAIAMGTNDRVYASDELQGMRVFLRNPGSGALTLLQTVTSQLDRIRDIAVSPNGRNVYVTSEFEDALEVLTHDQVTDQLESTQLFEDGQGGVDGLNNASSVVVSPDGRHVYVGNAENSIALFDRDAIFGTLSFAAVFPETVANTLEDVTDLDVSPDGKNLYAAPADNHVSGPTVFTRNALTGALTFLETGTSPDPLKPNVRTVGTQAVAVTADGSFVVGANRQTTSIYSRDASGHLELLGGEAGGAVRLAVTLDDDFVYTATSASALGVYRRMNKICTPVPKLGCRRPTVSGKSTVRWKDSPESTGDRFDWKWPLGLATDLIEIGDPVNLPDDVIVCAYDASGPIFHTVAPAGGDCAGKPCWKVRGSTIGRRTLKYRDIDRRPDGLDKLELKEGASGAARLKVKAKERYLNTPIMPLVPPVTVQVQSQTICWESVFSTSQVNDGAQFKAKAD